MSQSFHDSRRRARGFTLIEIMVVVVEIDRQGRVNLSRKAAMQRHLAKSPA